MAGVLAFGEVTQGALNSQSLEVVAAAKALAAELGEPLLGGLIGSVSDDVSQEFLSAGMEQLFVVSGSEYETYVGDAFVAAAEAIVQQASPTVVLFPHTLNTREWAPRLSARLDVGLTTDAVRFAVQDGQVVVTKPIYGGSVFAEYVGSASPQMATVRPGAFEAEAGQASGSVVAVDAPAVDARVTVLEEVQDVVSEGPQLKDAKRVVSGGLGIGGPDHWHLVEETASILGAAVGATRAVTDLGWVPSSYQVGLTGTNISPDLYIAIGVSGAIQHMAGISQAKNVVAINRDEEAPIFTVARYGVVGDAKEILPAFTERVKQISDGS